MSIAEFILMALFAAWAFYAVTRQDDRGWAAVPVVLAVGTHALMFSDWSDRRYREYEATERINSTPHVVRSFADCKVYAWKDGLGWHESTRCEHGASNTSTTHQECHLQGKTQSCHGVTEHLESN